MKPATNTARDCRIARSVKFLAAELDIWRERAEGIDADAATGHDRDSRCGEHSAME